MSATRRPRSSADDRLRRLLALIPWVASQDGPTVEETCARFGCTPKELIADIELLFLCGVHPYTPDELIEAVVDDGRVFIRYADWFRRPLRLTPAEGLALVASGSALLDMPGTDPEGPLARGLAKVASVLGVAPGEGLDVELGDVEPTVLATVREAAEARRQVAIDYYSFGRDGWATRTIDPWSVFSRQGAWYVNAHCHLAGDRRLFRIDRIRSATALDTTFAAPDGPLDGATFSPRDDDPVVVLDLAPAARWVAGAYPHEGAEDRPDGGLRLRLRISEQAWLERLLLRLGPAATVVDGPPALRAAARDAATRLLARYR